jgi:hypothetical protein
VHSTDYTTPTADDPDDTAPLPSLPLASLTLSPHEVAHAFHLPLSGAADPARLRAHPLRRGLDMAPYWAVGVSDLVPGGTGAWNAAAGQPDEVGGGRDGALEVWGLTGWYLNVLMRALGVYR